MTQFRDPIHGFIKVTKDELRIIDSEPFQRLRNIKQLATTYLVYHGAEHTRFGHSLGVMHLVSKAFNNALDNYKRKNGIDLFDNNKRKWYEQILRLIALTHDLGHAPFSHASEVLFDNNLEHEDFTEKIIMETEIADIIKEIGEDFKKENDVGDEYNITPELLWLIYGEKKPDLKPEYKWPDYKFLKSFMDSELDCDKMDYLLRDSYYCGVSYGKFDLNRLLSTLNVYKDDNLLLLAVERGGLHAFEEFVIARYFMFIQVYFHKTRRYFDKLLVDSIKEVLPEQKYPSEVKEYLNYDDTVIIDKIKEMGKNNENSKSKEFLNRKVMSCIYETKIHDKGSSDHKLYDKIKKEIIKNNIEIYEDEAEKSPHKIPLINLYNDDSGKGIPILIDNIDEPDNILELSLLLRSLNPINPINIKRIYVSRTDAINAREIINNF